MGKPLENIMWKRQFFVRRLPYFVEEVVAGEPGVGDEDDDHDQREADCCTWTRDLFNDNSIGKKENERKIKEIWNKLKKKRPQNIYMTG